MNVTCKPIKEVFKSKDSDFRVLSCVAVGLPPNELALSKWGNFTLSGSNLHPFSLYQEYSLDIIPQQKSKYEASYIVVGFQGIEVGKNITVDPKIEFKFLKNIMTEGQATNVHTAYPNFIELILNNRESEIDYGKITNVGSIYLEKYIDKIKASYKSILFMNIANEWEIEGDKRIEKLTQEFVTPDEAYQAFQTNPYRVLVDVVEYKFDTADKKILEKMPEMIDSRERCEYGCLKVLKENESPDEGGQNTRIKARILANLVEDEVPEAAHHVVDVIKNGELIYYDPVSKNASIRKTYEDERFIADEILRRVGKVESCNMDWEKFRSIDGFDCTDEQAEILRLANERSVMMLTGSAGCVDADTEFFNGEQWKRIADYQVGDKVLQYNEDGSAELVEPERYIKEPCDTFYWVKAPFSGLDMKLSDDHNVIYFNDHSKSLCSISMENLYKKHNELSGGFYHRFLNSFTYSGTGIDLTNTEIELMCAIICDGSFYSKAKAHQNSYMTCKLQFRKERKIEEAEKLLQKYEAESGHKYRKVIDTKHNTVKFYCHAPIREKIFSSMWFNCSNAQLNIVCKNIMKWNGSTYKEKNNKTSQRYSTTIKENADFIQYAFSGCNHKATIIVNDRTVSRGDKHVEYVVSVHNKNTSSLGSVTKRNGRKKTEIPLYNSIDGYKYCFTVPSGMLVLRSTNKIFITGNCGKTTSMISTIKMLEHYMKSYTILCPTGVASKKISQATGRPASTIHMFLARLQDTICSSEYVLIDEMSMVGVELFAKLLTAIPNSKIIMIGDDAQLASISCGNVLYDIIHSNVVPKANLTKVFRYGIGGISTVATDIREGRAYLDNSGKPVFQAEVDDYKFTPIASKLENVIPQVLEAYEDLIDKGYNKADIMILSPQNVGSAGTYRINEAIQTRFNNHVYTNVSYEKQIKGGNIEIKFKVGDRVVNTHNNYKSPVMEQTDEGLVFTGVQVLIANGDIGYIRDCVADQELGNYLVIQYDEYLIGVHGSAIEDLLLGYALSIHRVQGSQAEAVILITHRTHRQMVKRNLLYVGASRAQKYLMQIGDVGGIEAGLEIQEQMSRDTWLQDLLKENKE